VTEIAVRQPMELATKMDYARAMAGSNLLPKQYQNQPANLLFALEYADALGVAPISAITSIHVIEGKPSASADLIAALVRRAGHKMRISGDDTYALAQIIRADDPEFVYEARWDMAKARAASLTGKGVWKSYPGAMLRSRAITEVARMGASDALFGVIYTPEELGAEVSSDGLPLAPTPLASAAAPRSGADRLRQAMGPAEPVPSQEESAPPEPDVEPVKATAERGDDSISAAQLKALHAGLTGLGIKDRDAGLATISQVIDREITTSKDLTKAEASQVIEWVKFEESQDAGAEPPLDGME
jgi:hypothetical protein